MTATVLSPSTPGRSPHPRTEVDHFAAARPLEFEPTVLRRNHYVFRYPAKFHPPVARQLVELFSSAGDTVLDPFCGSGTLLVEAATLNRHSIGIDVDPLAVFIASAKTSLCDLVAIRAAAVAFAERIDSLRAEDLARWGAFDVDIEEDAYYAAAREVAPFIPELPSLRHWFRRRVTLQLAIMRREIRSLYEGESAEFLRLCFASIIRNSSNADPVPVSGLEVTRHMLAKEEAGRTVDPWSLMIRAVRNSLGAVVAFNQDRVAGVKASVSQGDARELPADLVGAADAVITSPPYLTAVDYYRRHTLEMYWLGLTDRREDRLEIMTKYIGRDRVAWRHLPDAAATFGVDVASRWLTRFPGIKSERERAFRHYCDGMSRALAQMRAVVKPRHPIVIVAGDVRFCGVPVSMLELMSDLGGDMLTMTDHLWYPIRNRYMSYSRHNQANIAADHVLVFRSKI